AAPGIEAALPGGLLKAVRTEEERLQVHGELAREAQPVAELAPSGVAIYADALGGLEALAFECREARIPIHEAGVGPVGRPTVLRIATVKEPLHRAIFAFNVPVLPDAVGPGEEGQVRVFTSDVMYRLLEEYSEWRLAQEAALNAQRRIDWVQSGEVRGPAGIRIPGLEAG
ncbi:translation initiation factor aIF 2, partial [mine drainage metagenome]